MKTQLAALEAHARRYQQQVRRLGSDRECEESTLTAWLMGGYVVLLVPVGGNECSACGRDAGEEATASLERAQLGGDQRRGGRLDGTICRRLQFCWWRPSLERGLMTSLFSVPQECGD